MGLTTGWAADANMVVFRAREVYDSGIGNPKSEIPAK
jgi:hypothetical protein